MDLQKMKAAAIALRDNNCEENYIEHINQSCPANVLELIAQCEHIDTNKQAPIGHIQVDTEHGYSFIAGDGIDYLMDGRHAVYLQGEQQEPACYLIDDGYSKTTTLDPASLKIAKRFNWVVTPLYAHPIPAQQSPAVAVPDEETNFCALKSITDSQVNAVVRAFWRRIYAYRNDYDIELPKPLPVEFMAHMATALTWVDKEPTPRATDRQEPKFVDLRQIVSDGSES